jgi:hypothetical protein
MLISNELYTIISILVYAKRTHIVTIRVIQIVEARP